MFMSIPTIPRGHSLIINDCLESGTQLPYIKQAMSVSAKSIHCLGSVTCFRLTQEGYGVIVLNTNYNQAEPDGPLIRVRCLF